MAELKNTDKAKAKLGILKQKIICCKLYISESQNTKVVDAISRVGQKDPEVVLLSKFEDDHYNRVRYTLASYIINDSTTGEVFSPMRRVLLEMIKMAFSTINLEMHTGTHPRIGVIDDMAFHPLNQATMEDAARLAKMVATDIGNGLQVPVFLYGAAHPTSKSVTAVRRELGYYRPNYMGIQWTGQVLPDTLPMKPDEGPNHVSRERGAIMIGAAPLPLSYNVPVLSKDIPTVRRITRRVTGRGGGFPTVQALALSHGDDCTEIACFMDPDYVSADQVQRQVEEIAAEQGIEVDKGYLTDFTKDMMLEKYFKIVLVID
uniref:Formiminotransferase N-terminal subdomain domain-containing protein n=1 Tax=Leersia perrieri TaxID=77586 RepID=A0A0D9VVX0_9ORYZ